MTLRGDLRRLQRRTRVVPCRSCGGSGPRGPDAAAWEELFDDEPAADRVAWAAVIGPVVARARAAGCAYAFCPTCGRPTGMPLVLRNATPDEHREVGRLLAAVRSRRGRVDDDQPLGTTGTDRATD